MKKIINIFFLIVSFNLFSQEMNCQIIVNSDLVNQTNQQIFKTLQNSLNEFVNLNIWTEKKTLYNEKISSSIIINLSKYNSSNFEGSIQIQAQRPVYNSNYDSPILNILDDDISFKYLEFEPLFYNKTNFESNLVSLISFYIYIIIGLHSDSFENNSGTKYFNEALKILNFAQNSSYKGWKQSDGSNNRFWLIDSLLSNTYLEFRSIFYKYHRTGLDSMVLNSRLGKENIITSLSLFENLYSIRPNSYLIQSFFDTKSTEIVDILSEGPKIELKKTIKLLNKVSPFFAHKWKKIKN